MRMDNLGFLDPRSVGQTEYDAIWQCVNDVLANTEWDGSDDGDEAEPDYAAIAIATLDELISVCNSMKEIVLHHPKPIDLRCPEAGRCEREGQCEEDGYCPRAVPMWQGAPIETDGPYKGNPLPGEV